MDLSGTAHPDRENGQGQWGKWAEGKQGAHRTSPRLIGRQARSRRATRATGGGARPLFEGGAAADRPPPGNSESATLSKGGCYHLWEKLRCPGHRGLMLILQPSTRVNDSCVRKKPPVLQRISSAQLALTTWKGDMNRRQYAGLATLQSTRFLNVHSAQCPVHGAVLNIQINKAWSVSVDEMFT